MAFSAVVLDSTPSSHALLLRLVYETWTWFMDTSRSQMGRTNTRRQQQTHSLSVWCVCGLCTCTINERVCTCLQTVRAGSQLEAFSVSPVTSPTGRTTLHETFHSRSAPGVLHLFFSFFMTTHLHMCWFWIFVINWRMKSFFMCWEENILLGLPGKVTKLKTDCFSELIKGHNRTAMPQTYDDLIHNDALL